MLGAANQGARYPTALETPCPVPTPRSPTSHLFLRISLSPSCTRVGLNGGNTRSRESSMRHRKHETWAHQRNAKSAQARPCLFLTIYTPPRIALGSLRSSRERERQRERCKNQQHRKSWRSQTTNSRRRERRGGGCKNPVSGEPFADSSSPAASMVMWRGTHRHRSFTLALSIETGRTCDSDRAIIRAKQGAVCLAAD